MQKLPAFASVHSHAFQRGMRGAAQRKAPGQTDDFWGWREAMYGLAGSLTPESIYDISLVAYRELARAGVLTVGEFHYVHHQPDGTPYTERTVMSDAVIRAAEEAGLLGAAGSFVCLCPTTERDLGDGLPDLGALLEENVRPCFGVDGHVMSDPFEEMRGAMLGERLRTGRRFGPWIAPAERLWKAASDEGAHALGFDDAGGYLEIEKGSPALELVTEDHWLDALVFSGSAAVVARVVRTC